MKTAVSIPDHVFESADQLAAKLGVSRSQLYATAVAEFLAKHRDQHITDQLNDVFSREPSGLDGSFRAAQAKSVKSPDW